jgi:hypothetical protein
MEEQWKRVEGFPAYDVSNRGRVRSYYRRGRGAHIADTPQRILKPVPLTTGYLSVGLRKNGELTTTRIHKMVALAFLPLADSSLQLNHKDGNKSNNTAENLEWVTARQNVRHYLNVLGGAIANNFKEQQGEKNHQAKLTDSQAVTIRALYSTGEYSHREIAKMYGVSKPTVGRIIRRQTWTHI